MSSSSRSSGKAAVLPAPAMGDGVRYVTGVPAARSAVKVALLTGGKDPHYVGGLIRELAARGVDVALVGGSELAPHATADRIDFHNLVGSQNPSDGLLAKAWRVLAYYARLIRFAARTDARLFHVLWCRKFPVVERTLLSAYFKALRKRLIFTAHNVDDEARDGRRRTLRGQLSLRFLYRVADHILVHTDSMKRELTEHFKVPDAKVTVVPLGINDVIPLSPENRAEARRKLGIGSEEKVLLFFGNIAPYKGVEDLVRALGALVRDDHAFRLIIAGPVRDKSSEAYWHGVEQLSRELGVEELVHKTIGYIPDAEVGRYFRASDVVILPYRRIYQSGVLPLSYAQGAPVIVANVGSLPADVIEGETGLVFKAGDVPDLVATIRAYFRSELFRELEDRGSRIRQHGVERFSWKTNAERTCAVYERMLAN